MKFINSLLLAFGVVKAFCDLKECQKGDVNCFARCLNVPNPTRDQVEEATDCNAQCGLDNNATEACFISCVTDIFLRERPTESETNSRPSSTSSTSSSIGKSSVSLTSITDVTSSTKINISNAPVSSKPVTSTRGLPDTDSSDALPLSVSFFIVVIASAMAYYY